MTFTDEDTQWLKETLWAQSEKSKALLHRLECAERLLEWSKYCTECTPINTECDGFKAYQAWCKSAGKE